MSLKYVEGAENSLLSLIRRKASEMGARIFGIADLTVARRIEPSMFSSFDARFSRAVVMGIRLHSAVLDMLVDRPTPLYFHHYRQTNYRLDEAAWTVADILQESGFLAVAIPASQIVAKSPMRADVSHRLLGWAAGLGFRGRNNLLVHPKFGSQVRYVSVLTNASFSPGEPLNLSCGNCRACVSVCPAGAIKETVEEFDSSLCQRKLNEFAALPFIGQHICGLCVKACGMRREPINGSS